MDNAQLWALILGFVIPIVVSVVNQPHFSARARVIVVAIVCLAVGTGTSYFAGSFSHRDTVSAILISLVAAITAYHGLYGPTGAATVIENGTSPRRGKHRG